MRFRNFVPLLLLFFITMPTGLGFIFLWEGYLWVLMASQLVYMVFLVVTYRAGMQSGRKNFPGAEKIGSIVYLPLKFNLVLYLLVGLPLVWNFYPRAGVLMIAYAAGFAGFALAYLSGLTFIARSRP